MTKCFLELKEKQNPFFVIDDGPAYDDLMSTMEKRVEELVSYVIKNYGDASKGGVMGAAGGKPDSFESMVMDDLENTQQKKARNIFVS